MPLDDAFIRYATPYFLRALEEQRYLTFEFEVLEYEDLPDGVRVIKKVRAIPHSAYFKREKPEATFGVPPSVEKRTLLGGNRKPRDFQPD